MTSTEFAAKYRLLKNVATRGARSFLAQQVELGRMVMVHYLDSETPEQRAATLARLESLTGAARVKLLDIADVDGFPVAVTLFISSFVDFATWLDSVSADAPPPPPPPAFAALESPLETPTETGEFTLAPSVQEEDDSPTLIMEPVKPAPASEPVSSAPPPPAPAPAPDTDSSFTAIFGRFSEAPSAPASIPAAASWSQPNDSAVMPPVAPPSSDLPSAPALSTPDTQPQPGEFTQLFQRISPSAGSPMASIPMPSPSFSAPPAPLRPPETARPLEITPAADLAPPSFANSFMAPPVPLPTPSFGAMGSSPLGLGGFGSAPPIGASPPNLPPAPNFSASPNDNGTPAPAAPTPVWGGAVAPSFGSSIDGGGQSEFTRILGRVAVPLPPPTAADARPPSNAATQNAARPTKSLVPLLIALNVVVLMSIAIVAYFMLRKS